MENPILRIPGESLRDWKSSSKTSNARRTVSPHMTGREGVLIQSNMARRGLVTKTNKKSLGSYLSQSQTA